MNSGFGKYLKDYLEFYNITQSEFASRLNITQKHMNEILNCKSDITLEMAANIEQITGISISFIIKSEYRKFVEKYLYSIYKNEKEINEDMKKRFVMNELNERKWVEFMDITNPIQNYIDIITFLKVKDLEALKNIQEKTLFKKTGNDLNKLNLWIARCDELANQQEVKEYIKDNFYFLIDDLKRIAYKDGFDIDEIRDLFNKYGIYFIVEKALKRY